MAGMDIFTQSAFNTVQLTSAFERIPYQPQLLDELGVFEPAPVRTRHISIEKRDGFLSLIPTTPVGAPITELVNDKRDIRDFRTVRLAKGFTVYAEELNGIRQFGTETELMQVQAEVARRSQRVKNDFQLTFENMRLGALQGLLVDADGTVIKNWFSEWGIAAPTPVSFKLDVSTTDVATVCKNLVRNMARASKGAITPATKIHALVGDTFFDMLIAHSSVKQFYMNWQAASSLRDSASQVFESFEFGGIVWHNYRGTDDNSTVAIPTGRAAFFPVGAQETFKVAYGPAEFEPWINTNGQEFFELTIPDIQRGAWQKFEVYSYPLHICQRPEVLQAGKATDATS